MKMLECIDGYKADHRSQYPVGTTCLFSNFTARASRVEGVDKTVFFGLQYFLKEYLVKQWNESFFHRPKDVVVNEYKRIMDSYLGPNAIAYKHIEDLHTLGYLPLEIKALPEGSLVELRVPSLVLWNTHPDFFWLTNYIETILSCSLWMACTSATTAHQYRKVLTQYANKTSSIPEFVPFSFHDFSFRGHGSLESACISGAAHLLSSVGSDSVPAISWLEKYYGADCTKELVACSVAALEHSTASSSILDNYAELDKNIPHEERMEIAEGMFLERIITKVYPKGIVSFIADTYDYYRLVTKILPKYKDKIMARDGKLVIRPDSGPSPEAMICGDINAPVGSNEYKGSIELLWEIFGGKVNDKGYKELDPHIGLIYGDSITIERCKKICEMLKAKGFASTNVVLGVGSFSYTYVTRDTYSYAIKGVYTEINGKPRNIYKSPKGDNVKKSACGLLAVYQNHDDPKHGFFLEEQATWHNVHNCAFNTVFKDGQLHNEQTLSQIRARLLACT